MFSLYINVLRIFSLIFSFSRNSCYSKAREAFNESIRLEKDGKTEKNHILLSKIGIGKTYEGEGDAESAESWFKDSASALIESNSISNEAMESLTKTAEGLENLRLLNVSNEKKIRFMKDALELYEKALEIAVEIKSPFSNTLLLREKVRLLDKQIRRAGKYQAIAVTSPKVGGPSSKKSLDEILSIDIGIKNENEIFMNIHSQISKNPENYALFKGVFETEFSQEMKSKKYLIFGLDRLVGFCLKQESKESQLETSVKLFQHSQILCKELYGKDYEQTFFDLFNSHIINRFRKIVLGIEYKLGPIESEEQYEHLLKRFESSFGRLGVKQPSFNEVKNEISKRTRFKNEPMVIPHN